MNKKIALLWILLLAAMNIHSQEDTIKAQILSYKDSEYDFLNKGRRLLLEHLQSNKLHDVIAVKNSLLHEFDGNVSAVFYNSEYVHLLYWAGEFSELLNYLKQVDLEQPVTNNVMVSAQTDQFFTTVQSYLIENPDILEMDIKNALLEDVETDFLLLLLHDLAILNQQREQPNAEQRMRINQMADVFLTNYQDSPYHPFVRENIRWVYKEKDWGFYMDIGFGAALLQGDLSHQFNNGALMDMLFEYRHRRMLGMLGFGFSGHILKEDLPINETTWKKGASATMGNIYLNAGVLVFENRKWSIYPYGGIGYTGFSALQKDIDEDENLEKLGLNSFFTQLGLGVDMKFNVSPSIYTSSNSRLSLKYVYRMPHFDRKDPILKGSQHIITLSYGIGGRGLERDL